MLQAAQALAQVVELVRLVLPIGAMEVAVAHLITIRVALAALAS
jgi:hypothetical protein